MSVGIVRAACGRGHVFSVANEPLRTAGCLHNSPVAGIVLFICAIVDNGAAIFQDSKEVVITCGSERNAVDVSDAGGLSRRHIVKRRVDAGDNIVVFADKLRRRGIAVILICGSDLFRQLGHSENPVSVLVFIRRLHNNIVSGNIRDGHIIDHLVAVLGIGVVDILFYAGRKGCGCAFEHIMCFRNKFFVIRRRGNGQKSEQHGKTKNKRGESFCEISSFHVAAPFPNIIINA